MNTAILVLVEHLKGELADITYEMLGVGRRLADASQSPLYAALLGHGVVPLAERLGLADSVLVVDHPQLRLPSAEVAAGLVKELIERQGVALTLIGGTNISMGVGSILAARSKLPFVNFAKDLRRENDGIVVTSQLLGGKMLVDAGLPGGRGVVSVYPGAFSAEAGRSAKVPAVEQLDLTVETPKVIFRKFLEPETGDVDITKQEVLVAVGRGIQTQDNLALAEDLAQALGGAVCASRPVIDQGWLPLSRQVGKSGMTVKPRLYLALGVSGAPEHVEGMKSAQLVIAVNTDAKAPIFDVAHYGVCGDVLEILPPLTEKIKAIKTRPAA
ncbi:MAG: electron transfer flavoprotein subunit alpha/FixB family protein [Chloroflexi bacterium]|nr:electron transfer flavoprotein subunit alpha/FixB family protein [Chloroflexota bacterium]